MRESFGKIDICLRVNSHIKFIIIKLKKSVSTNLFVLGKRFVNKYLFQVLNHLMLHYYFLEASIEEIII